VLPSTANEPTPAATGTLDPLDVEESSSDGEDVKLSEGSDWSDDDVASKKTAGRGTLKSIEDAKCREVIKLVKLFFVDNMLTHGAFPSTQSSNEYVLDSIYHSWLQANPSGVLADAMSKLFHSLFVPFTDFYIF